MDNLIKDESNLMLAFQESFPTQIHADGYQEASAWRASFVVSESVTQPIVQSYKVPVRNPTPASLLTTRETEILELFGKGLSVKGVARGLAICPGTVKWHVKNIYYKLGASSREDALHKARLRQLIQ